MMYDNIWLISSGCQLDQRLVNQAKTQEIVKTPYHKKCFFAMCNCQKNMQVLIKEIDSPTIWNRLSTKTSSRIASLNRRQPTTAVERNTSTRTATQKSIQNEHTVRCSLCLWGQKKEVVVKTGQIFREWGSIPNKPSEEGTVPQHHFFHVVHLRNRSPEAEPSGLHSQQHVRHITRQNEISARLTPTPKGTKQLTSESACSAAWGQGEEKDSSQGLPSQRAQAQAQSWGVN